MKRILALALILSGCASDPAARTFRVGTTGHLYVMSDINADPLTEGAPTWSSGDGPDCGTKADPCLTLYGAEARALEMGLADTTWIVHLGGWSAPGSANGPSDPWDAYPTEPRMYVAPVVRLYSGQATRNTFAYVGPRKMHAKAVPSGYMGAVQVAPGRAVLRFAYQPLPIGVSGLFLRWVRPDGRELAFPHVITQVTSQGLVVDSKGISASDWDWYSYGGLGEGAPTWEACAPAAHIVGSLEEQSHPVVIRGDLPEAIGDGLNAGQPTGTNPLPAMAFLMVFNPRLQHRGELFWFAMWGDIETRAESGSVRMRAVTAAPNGNVVYMGQARALTEESGQDAAHERAGWALVPTPYGAAPIPEADPYIQWQGPLDLVVSGGVLWVGGRGQPQGAGVLPIFHGLSVYREIPDGPPIRVIGAGSLLDVGAGARLFADEMAASLGGSIRYDVSSASVGTVKVGRGAAAVLGAGQRIDGDDGSAAWDRAWETN